MVHGSVTELRRKEPVDDIVLRIVVTTWTDCKETVTLTRVTGDELQILSRGHAALNGESIYSKLCFDVVGCQWVLYVEKP